MNELMTIDKVKQDEERFITDLIETKGANLPAKVEDVLHVFEFTDWKAKAWKTLADKIGRLEDQSEAYHSALRSGQQWGIAALYAQKRMGEITREMPVEYETPESDIPEYDGKRKKGLVKHSEYMVAERIASHPEILDEVIQGAQKRGDIPTKTAVLNRIRMEDAQRSAEAKRLKAEDKIDKKRPKAVADYFDAIKIFKHSIELARIAAERGKFDPAGLNFLTKKREEINNLMIEVEELVK